jgi:hypothetical protein
MTVSGRDSSRPGYSLIGPDLGKLRAVQTCAGEVSAAEIGVGEVGSAKIGIAEARSALGSIRPDGDAARRLQPGFTATSTAPDRPCLLRYACTQPKAPATPSTRLRSFRDHRFRGLLATFTACTAAHRLVQARVWVSITTSEHPGIAHGPYTVADLLELLRC